jgi:transcriptional antiterminator RfaH
MPDASLSPSATLDDPSTTSGYWACARFEPGRERLAQHLLGIAGFTTYFPVAPIRKRSVSGRRVAGLFGLYFFAVIEQRWYDLRWSPGISGVLLGPDSRPARVGDEVIAALRAREDEHGFIQLSKRREWEFAVGDQLRITKGPLSGHFCLFEGMSTRERVEVLLMMLGSERRVSVARADVKLVCDSPVKT